MNHLKTTTILLIFLSIVLGISLYDSPQELPKEDRAEIIFENHSFDVEIADTPEEREKGLMNRENVGENEGMLFVYEEEDYRSFWMKNTFIPLDIIFLDSNLEVINIEKANPEPNTSDDNLQRYRSESPAQYVLEINQNRSEEIGLEKGSEMSLRP
ncbi:MAG: DUF192 domain-containing protein [Candidatus Nanohaloarchaea archaeon]